MIRFGFPRPQSGPLNVLCLGAHADDIEIGCGGTLLRLVEEYPESVVHWVVFSAHGERAAEARRGATLFGGSSLGKIVVHDFKDGFMPYAGAEVKSVFESELKVVDPDVIFTHTRYDEHQDHRLISELTWNTFRDHLILEYEIPKYDGDLGRPSVFVPLAAGVCEQKAKFIAEAFGSQDDKHWFSRDTFFAMMRLRGMECNSFSGLAEAFYCRKLMF